MSAEKRIPISMKLKPSFVKQVKEHAKLENRSMTGFFEYATMKYIQQNTKYSSGSAGVQPEGDDDRP